MLKIISILFIIFFLGCATLNDINRELNLSHLNLLVEIQTSFIPYKSVYSKIENTTFIMELDVSKIHIYDGSKKVNTIGGLGFNEYSFNKLTDISLSPDGNLLALDSFEKVIKKFDKDGKWITEFNLDFMVKPQIFDISLDETFYIYDRNRKEIISKRITDDVTSNSFGKFILSEPESIVVNDGFVQVYDRQLDKTLIFDLWGDLLQEEEGKVLFHKKQKYLLSDYSLVKFPEEEKVAVNIRTWNSFFIKYNLLLLNSDTNVKVSEFIYEI